MNESMEKLALRKQLLQARSAYYRLKVRHDLHNISGNLHWARLGAKAITLLPIRSTLFGIILKSLRGSRRGRLIGSVIRFIVFAKAASAVAHLLRRLSAR